MARRTQRACYRTKLKEGVLMSIEIRNVKKNFGDFSALNDVTLDVPSEYFMARTVKKSGTSN